MQRMNDSNKNSKMIAIKTFAKSWWTVILVLMSASLFIYGALKENAYCFYAGLCLTPLFFFVSLLNGLPGNKKEKVQRIILALAKWMIFSVIIGLLPIITNFVHQLTKISDNASTSLTVKSLLKNGDLLIVCAVLAAGIIGDSFFHGIEKTDSETGTVARCRSLSDELISYTTIGFCLFISVLSSVWFMGLSGNDKIGDKSIDTTYYASLIMFVSVVVLGVISAVYKELRR